MAHVQIETPPRKVILELTEDEAAMVYILVWSLGDAGDHSGVVFSIYRALRSCFPNIKRGDFLETYPRWQKTTPQFPRVEA